MSTLNIDLLDALRKAGVDEDVARRAAHSVLGIEEREQLVTQQFMRAEFAEIKAALEARFAPLESDLRWTKWIITGGVGLYVLRSLLELLR
ncbi:MAG: hypothetical protein H0T87_04960 [Gammaproteobacteria bacterium]|nr:hypothetical protein [Gammaproteobacteria bacterium]